MVGMVICLFDLILASINNLDFAAIPADYGFDRVNVACDFALPILISTPTESP